MLTSPSVEDDLRSVRSFDTRGYLRNKFAEKDPAQVKGIEHQAFRSHVHDAITQLRSSKPLSYHDVLATHRRLFHTVYPWAGQDRTTTAPDLMIGKGDRFNLFALPADVPRATEYALSHGGNAAAMRQKPGEVWGLLAYAHPFLEGNGRTIMLIHGELCRRAGMHISWKAIPKAEWLAALTRELDEPGRGHLDHFLKPHVQLQKITGKEKAVILKSLPGLGPAIEPEPPKGQAAASTQAHFDPKASPPVTTKSHQAPVQPMKADLAAPSQRPIPPLVPARDVRPPTGEELHGQVLKRKEVGSLRRTALAAAGAVYVDREAALAAVDRRLAADPAKPGPVATALDQAPEQFGALQGGVTRFGKDDAARQAAKTALPLLVEDVKAYGKAYRDGRRAVQASMQDRIEAARIEVPGVSAELRPFLTGERSLEGLPEADRERLRQQAWPIKDAIERRFSTQELGAMAQEDVSPLRQAGVTGNVAQLAAMVTRATSITAELAPKETREQTQTQQKGSSLEQ